MFAHSSPWSRIKGVTWRRGAEAPPALPAPDDLAALPQDIIRECQAMVSYATTWGKRIPADLPDRIEQALGRQGKGVGGLADLLRVHGDLTELVAPAHPNTILLMNEEKLRHPVLHALGPVRLVRQLLLFATLCLIMLCGLSTASLIQANILAKNWLELDGWTALTVDLFLLSTASLGSAFANLSIVNRFIAHGTYDQKYDSTYWIRVMLGMMSALILGEILFDAVFKPGLSDGKSPEMIALGRIGVTFLGGYSAAQVQAVLDNLSAALGTLTRGAPSQRPAAMPPAKP